MMKQTYDLIFSLGEVCFAASFLKKLSLRSMSSPFDWIAGGTFETRVNYLINDFKDFFNKEDLKFLSGRELVHPADIYQNTKSGIVFNHDFPINSNFETIYPQVSAKYQKREKRLIDTINASKNVLIVFIEQEESYSGIKDKTELIIHIDNIQKRFPNTQIHLLYIRNNDNLKDKGITREELSDKITYCECYNRDINNPSQIGAGNFKNIRYCFKDITCKHHIRFLLRRKCIQIRKNFIKMFYLHKKKPYKTEYIRICGIKVWKKPFGEETQKKPLKDNSHMMQNYKRMYPYIKPCITRAILAVLVTLPLGAMDAVIAWVLKPYMDTVVVEKTVQSISLFPLLIILFSFIQSFLSYLANYLNTWVGTKITLDVKRDLYKKMLRSDARFFDKTTSGTLLIRFNTDAEIACAGLLNNLKSFTTRLFSSISLVFVLIWNSWQLSIVAIIILFGALLPLATIRKKIKSIVGKNVMSMAAVMTHYNESFSGNRVIASFNLYNNRFNRFDDTLNDVFDLALKRVKKTGIVTPMMHVIVSVGIAGVIWLGSYLIATSQLTAGGFVSFITALLMLYHPIKSIGNNYTNVQMSLMSMDRIFSILDQIPQIHNCQNPKKLSGINDYIIYDHITFEYEPNRPVLKDVSLEIKKGQTIAFVGNSGGGKTTFVNLLPRFYDVKSGSIKIDGTDIRRFDIDSLRNNIAMVFQDNILFAGTIRENILLGKENATNEEIKNAVHNACLDEFISSLPKGLDTEIGERGTKLSGGQKQRVAIARAFLKDAPIVILDEATSALDNKSEEIVQQAIYNLMKDRTVFIIAHRLSTVKNADKIVVIDHGIIKEQGRHDELIAKESSVYGTLYKTQLK